jgi:hypothetical protein
MSSRQSLPSGRLWNFTCRASCQCADALRENRSRRGLYDDLDAPVVGAACLRAVVGNGT